MGRIYEWSRQNVKRTGWMSSSVTAHLEPAIHCCILEHKFLRSLSERLDAFRITSSIMRAAHDLIDCEESLTNSRSCFNPSVAPPVVKASPLSSCFSHSVNICKNWSALSTASHQKQGVQPGGESTLLFTWYWTVRRTCHMMMSSLARASNVFFFWSCQKWEPSVPSV